MMASNVFIFSLADPARFHKTGLFDFNIPVTLRKGQLGLKGIGEVINVKFACLANT